MDWLTIYRQPYSMFVLPSVLWTVQDNYFSRCDFPLNNFNFASFHCSWFILRCQELSVFSYWRWTGLCFCFTSCWTWTNDLNLKWVTLYQLSQICSPLLSACSPFHYLLGNKIQPLVYIFSLLNLLVRYFRFISKPWY